MNPFIKKIIPRFLYEWRMKSTMKKYRNMSIEEIFTGIYAQNQWGGQQGEFYSGPGTHNENVIKYIDTCIKLIRKENISSILDIGCGDFRVMSEVVKATNTNFIGADIAKNVIDHHNKVFSSEKIKFRHLNAITDELPKCDLITIRQVLQHLSNEQIGIILQKALASARFLLITEHLPKGDHIKYNLDKPAGPDIRLYRESGVYIEQPPFSLKKVTTLFEYDEDFEVFGSLKKAVMRTSLVQVN
jgi:SAM-dependent methyltransferase